MLLDRRVVRVHRNGLSRTFAQRVVQMRDRPRRRARTRSSRSTTRPAARRSRSGRRASTAAARAGALEVLEATDRGDQDLSEPWYGLYYDNRAEVVRFEGLRPGDVLEIQYLVDDVAQREPAGRLLRRPAVHRRDDPEAPLGLHADRAREPRRSTPTRRALPRLERAMTEERRASASTASRARDVAEIDAEPAMPGLAEVAPYLHVSTYATWDEVGALVLAAGRGAAGARRRDRAGRRARLVTRGRRRRASGCAPSTTSWSRTRATWASSSASTATSRTG